MRSNKEEPGDCVTRLFLLWSQLMESASLLAGFKYGVRRLAAVLCFYKKVEQQAVPLHTYILY